MHTDKYFLVPSSIHQQSNAADNILNNLDVEMMILLTDKNLPADVKLAQYSQILQKYHFMKKEKEKPIEIPFFESNKKASNSDDEDILSSIPKTRLPIAKSLLYFLKKQPNREW